MLGAICAIALFAGFVYFMKNKDQVIGWIKNFKK